MGPLGRTLLHLAPPQVAHRVRLRAQKALRSGLPGAASRLARFRAGTPPPRRPLAAPDLDLLRPCGREWTRCTAKEVEAGLFSFLSEARDLGANPFPPPSDVPLLWAYHLEYMDYLLDLAVEGRWDAVRRLVRNRFEAERDSGPAGRHPYPESRRAASWVRTLSAGGPALLAEGAWRAACRVARNLELDVGGNHLLDNGLALVLVGSAFRGRRAGALLEKGSRILLAGAREQVLADGAHYEFSPMYHARVMQVLTEGGLALDSAGSPPPGEYWEVVGSMVTFLRGILGPGGRLPLFGDTARTDDLEPERLLDAVEARLPFPVETPEVGDRAYPDAGFYVFEDVAADHQLLLDAGPVCPERLPAHGQADTFSFVLCVSGQELVVDAGLHEYAAGTMRDWCRSTRAHSTVTVDGMDSSEVWGSFRVGRRARVRDVCWLRANGLATFSAQHDGYRHLGVCHGRLVSHLDEGLWLVADRLQGSSEHTCVSRIHLHPDTVVERREAGGWRVHRAGARLDIVPFGFSAMDWEEGWYCPTFGIRRRSRLLTLTAEGGARAFGTVLSAGGGEIGACLDGRSVRVRRGTADFTRSLP